MSINSSGIDVTSKGISQMMGFILFLIAGIMALLHKDDDNKKKRKAFAIILDFLDKINSVKEWNERLHELHTKLKQYEYLLPERIRSAIDSVADKKDLADLKALVAEELSKLESKPVKGIVKIVAVIVTLLSLGIGVYAWDNFWYPTPECNDGYHFENGSCVRDNVPPGQHQESGNINHVLTANAGLDQTVNEGQKVILDGSGSYDSEGNSLEYFWKKIKGLSVSLNKNDEKKIIFFAPEVTKDTSLIFQLTVSHQKSKDSDKVKVTILNVEKGLAPNPQLPNSPLPNPQLPNSPRANPSPNFDVDNSSPKVEAFFDPKSPTYTIDYNNNNNCIPKLVTLKAIASDTDGTIVSYKWKRNDGSTEGLEKDDQSKAIFTPPCIDQDYSFTVTVKDNNGAISSAEITFKVSQAVPSIG